MNSLVELERVHNPKISFVNPSQSEHSGFYSKIGNVSAEIGSAGIILELIANLNAGLIVNAGLASAIVFGIIMINLPEYRGE